jgi:UDP-N-acetyl-D-glucosamine dehydrogenase
VDLSGEVLESQEMMAAVADSDCVVIVTDHSGLDYAAVIDKSKVIVDTRNALKGFRSSKIVRL